jgi:beta-fructofuranosidase
MVRRVNSSDVDGRVRPVAHFTPRSGWMNDPYAVRWDGDSYHMCYQAVPDLTVWSPGCVWGHAVSRDLVAWEERAPVLVPQPYEVGCWSGCVVDDAGGVPRAFYTRVRIDGLELGSIAVARCDPSGRLASGSGDVVVAGPPDGMPVTAFRDPYVWREPAGWTMVVGVGTADGAGGVLQYRTRDLDRWWPTGVLCRGRVEAGHPTARQVWECPQMIEVDDTWVLIVSVQVGGRAGYVAAAVGSYDSARFVPTGWQRLAFGTAPYATSVFHDRDGRPCMISWLQEDPDRDTRTIGWAGAQSLVSELAVDRAGRITATPHPGVAHHAAFAGPSPATWPGECDLAAAGPGLATHLTAVVDGDAEIRLRHARQRLVQITRSPARDGLVVDRPGRASDIMPCRDPSAPVEVFIDADILEVFSGGAYGAWRLLSPD